MWSAIVLSCAAVTGIDVGWQPTEDGGVEYILQLDQAAIEVLEGGEIFESDIPSQVQDIRRLQISFGKRKLPRKLPPKKEPPPVAAREPGRFTPDDGAERLVPPGDGASALAKGAAKQGTPAEGVLPVEAVRPSAAKLPEGVSPLESLMSKKSAKPAATSGEGSSAGPAPQLLAAETPDEPRPWMPLVGAMLGLFGSLGANVFLGWMWYGERSKYRSTLARLAPRAS